MSKLQYHLALDSLHSHLINVRLTISSPAPQGQVLSLPAWIPGSYMIRDFAKNILNLAASKESGEPLEVENLDKQSWKVQVSSSPIVISYQVYAYDLSVRSAYICDQYAFFNGTSAFLCVRNQEDEHISLYLEKPVDSETKDWRVSTTMETHSGTKLYEFGAYQAANYAELIDHPVLFGRFDLVQFTCSGVDFELVLAGGHRADLSRLEKDLAVVCQHHLDLFGLPAPINRYVFQTLLSKDGFGGLEHRSSTALLFARDDLPSSHNQEMTEGYQTFLSLCSHELFHTWHVKRIQPIELQQAKLNEEIYTEQLWIYEGITSFYDDISLARTSLVDVEQYLRVLGENLTRLKRNAGRFKQTITESSFYAWTKFYKQDASAINNIVSYYLKGGFIAMCLDLMIRRDSDGEKSLDDLMRSLWQQHGKTGIGTDKLVIQRLLKQELNLNFDAFLERALYSHDELPVAELLEHAGLQLLSRPRKTPSDKGGKPESKVGKSYFGAQIKSLGTGIKVLQILENSPAMQAGLCIGDQLLSVNQWQVSDSSIQSLLDDFADQDTVELHVLRDGRLLQLSMPVRAAIEDTHYIEIKDRTKLQTWLSPTQVQIN